VCHSGRPAVSVVLPVVSFAVDVRKRSDQQLLPCGNLGMPQLPGSHELLQVHCEPLLLLVAAEPKRRHRQLRDVDRCHAAAVRIGLRRV